MNANAVFALSKGYTDETVIGGGALKGKNCTIQGTSEDAQGNSVVTFGWTLDDGTNKTTNLTVKKGIDAKQISSIVLDATDNHIKVTMSDSTVFDAGEMPLEPVKVSKAEGNALESKTDGLYVSSSGVEISKVTDNAIETKEDGLYVKKTNDVEISKDEGNIIEEKNDGLYASADKISISKEEKNILAEKQDGLYVPETDLSDYAKSEDVVAKSQGEANKGKVLGIGEDGNVTPITVPTPDLSGYAKSDYEIASAGTDLNNLKTTGRHFFIHNRTYSNLPTNVVNGWLDVKVSKGASSVVKQVLYRQGTNNTNDFEVYVRTFSTTWSEWARLATTKDLGTKHTISYTNTSGQTKSITVYGS